MLPITPTIEGPVVETAARVPGAAEEGLPVSQYKAVSCKAGDVVVLASNTALRLNSDSSSSCSSACALILTYDRYIRISESKQL